jgi:hypothetical protein
MGLTAAAEWVVGALLTRGKVAGQAIGAGGNYDTIIPCQGDSTLSIQVDMTGGALSDLMVQANPYEADIATVTPNAVPEVQTDSDFSGGHVYYYGQFDVNGVDQVRLRITNNNAGAQTITRMSWRLT